MPVEVTTRAEVELSAEDLDELEAFDVLRSDMAASLADGISRCEWYKQQSTLNQRILDKHLSDAEKKDIREGAESTEFKVKYSSRKRSVVTAAPVPLPSQATAQAHGGVYAALRDDASLTKGAVAVIEDEVCLLYTSPSPRDS